MLHEKQWVKRCKAPTRKGPLFGLGGWPFLCSCCACWCCALLCLPFETLPQWRGLGVAWLPGFASGVVVVVVFGWCVVDPATETTFGLSTLLLQLLMFSSVGAIGYIRGCEPIGGLLHELVCIAWGKFRNGLTNCQWRCIRTN